jgi:hypothetical protein
VPNDVLELKIGWPLEPVLPRLFAKLKPRSFVQRRGLDAPDQVKHYRVIDCSSVPGPIDSAALLDHFQRLVESGLYGTP